MTRDELANGGLEWRLSRALSQATGKPNLRDDKTLWTAFMSLKSLRDAIDHAVGGRHWHELANEEEQLFATLLAEPDLGRHSRLVRAIIDMYRPPTVAVTGVA